MSASANTQSQASQTEPRTKTEEKPPVDNGAIVPVAPRGRGRPTTFNRDQATYICEQLATGRSLRNICEEPGMPDDSVVRGWALDNQGGFFPHYTRARMLQQLAQIEEIGDIADAPPEYITTAVQIGSEKREERRVDPGYERHRQTRIDTRKWVAGKLLKDYSDKMQVDHRLTLDLKDISSEELAAIAARGRLTIEGQAVSEEAPEDAE